MQLQIILTSTKLFNFEYNTNKPSSQFYMVGIDIQFRLEIKNLKDIS